MKIYNPSLLSTDITGSIRLTNEATASLIGQLSSSLDNRYILSGSVSNADWDTLLNRPEGIVSESSQIDATQTTNFSTGVKSELDSNTVVSGSSQVIGILDSLNSYTGSNDTTNTTQNNRLDGLSTESGSIRSTVNTYTSSNDTTNTTQNNRLDGLSTFSGSTEGRLDNIESFTSSINTTIKSELDSNTVVSASSQVDVTQTTNYNQVVQTTNDQTICGNKTFSNNVIVSGDLSVNGTVNYTNTCNFNVGDNIIELNYGGSATVGGIYIKDASGTLTSGSILWNSSTDRWIAGSSGSESNVLLANSFGVVSGSSQIDAASTTNWTTNVKTRLNAETVISGSSQVRSLLPTGVVSGSSQVSYTALSSIPAGIVSGSTQITPLLPTGTISGSSQVQFLSISGRPSGLVSGSSQIDASQTTNWTTNVKTRLNAETVISGSSQVRSLLPTGVVSGSSQVSYTALSSIPAGIVSGSTQITPLLPTGTISGSSQVQFLSISGRPSGLVSGSSQIDASQTTNWTTNVKTRLNAETVISGSSQVSYTGLSNIPSGIVSGSTQITPLLPTGTVSGSSQIALNSTTGTLCVNKGGTGQTSYVNGELLIGNTTGNTLTKATLTGTTNQITVTNGAGSITLSTPQSINTAASVQFGSLGIGTTASGTSGEIRATNEITAFYSDDRLKTKLGKIENALHKVKELNGYYFVENETAKSLGYSNDKRQVGVSAQEVQAVLPEVVTTAPISDEYLTVRYEKIVPLLIEAVKEQNNIVETLINEIEELKNTINNRG